MWVHDLIVALFEFAVDINVLDVQDTQMHEDFTTVFSPSLHVDLTLFVQLEGLLLHFQLLLKIIQCILQLQCVCNVRHL